MSHSQARSIVSCKNWYLTSASCWLSSDQKSTLEFNDMNTLNNARNIQNCVDSGLKKQLGAIFK